MAGRTQLERQYLGQFSLAASTPTRQTFNFPLGELWYAMYLRIAFTLTTGGTLTNAVAYTDAAMEICNLIQLDVDRDGTLVKAPAKAMVRIGQTKAHTAPNIDNASFSATAGAAYAFSFMVPVFFADERMLRPEDTCLATDRYSQMSLIVGLGAGSDCLSTLGSAGTYAISAATCDVEIEKLQGPIPQGARPKFVQKMVVEGSPIDTSLTTNLGLTRSPSRAIKRLYAFASNLGVASRPWSGNGHNTVLSTISVESDQKAHDQNRRAAQVRDENKLRYEQETWPAGLHVLDYVRDGSNLSALSTGDKARLEVQQTEDSSNPAGQNNLSVVSEAIEALKA